MGVGIFFEKKFKDKLVEVYVGLDREWITYADSSAINGAILCLIFKGHDSGILTFETPDGEHEIYIPENIIQMFWKPGFKIMEHTKTMINTGQSVYNKKKNRDIMQ